MILKDTIVRSLGNKASGNSSFLGYYGFFISLIDIVDLHEQCTTGLSGNLRKTDLP
jgi:hypothetical protein